MRSAVLSAVLALCAPRATVGGFSNRKSIYTDTVFGSGVSETVGPGEIDFAAVAELMAGNNGTHDINCFTLGAQITRSDGVVVVYEDATPGEQASVAALREAAGCGSTIAVSHFGSQGELVEVFKKGAVVCPGGLIFPIFHGLNMWNPWFHAAIYALILIYLFMGVGVVSDKFMGAIEVITSSTVEAKNFRTGETQKQQVWNSTIANLSLMALGSSAPEILLAVVETLNTLGKPPQSGLGPATIVGSASFNLLVISAVCIIAVKPGGHRTIDDVPVFVVTASSSVFAYVWMYFVLRVASPNVIEMWEALLTLLMFPTLLIVAYGLDSRWPLMVRMIRCFTCGKVSRVDAEDKVEVVKSLTIKDIFQKKGDAKVSPSEGGEGGDEEDRVELIGRQVSKGHDQAHLVGTSGMGSGGFGILTDGRKKKEKSKSRKRVEMEEKVAAILKKHQALGGGELDPAQLSALVQHELAASAPRSRMENRSNAIKMLTGQRVMHGRPNKGAKAAMKALAGRGGKGEKHDIDLMWGMKAHSELSVTSLSGVDMSNPADSAPEYSAKIMWRHKSMPLQTPSSSPKAAPKAKRGSSPKQLMRKLSVKLGISTDDAAERAANAAANAKDFEWKATGLATAAATPDASGSVAWNFTATHDAVRYSTSAFKIVVFKGGEEIGSLPLQPPTKGGKKGDEILAGEDLLEENGDALVLSTSVQMELPPLRSVVMRNAEGVAAHEAIVQFPSSEYCAYEKEGSVKIKVERVGCLEGIVTVHWNTSNGTGKAGARYHAGSGEISFAHHQTEATIEVNIVDDDEYTPDLDFFVRLSEPPSVRASPKPAVGGALAIDTAAAVAEGAEGDVPVSAAVANAPCSLRLGSRLVARVVVIDDDVPGAFGFESSRISVTETSTVAECHVLRTGGADGRVELKYRTVSNTAIAGDDFVSREGWLTFAHHESMKTIEIPLIVTGKLSHHNVMFSVDLLLGPGDEELGPGEVPADGGGTPWTAGAIYSAQHHRTCVVAISNDSNFSNIVDLVMDDLFDDDGNLEKTGWGDLQQQSWLQQFEDAIFHENSDDDDDDDEDEEDDLEVGDGGGSCDGKADGDEAPKKDWNCCNVCTLSNIIKTVTRMNTLFTHAISIPWNIFAACAPPPGMCGGYPTFVVSLAMVGFVTALIGDVASEFGCFLGVDNGIVAITFVALGTSLPDTFASMSAAVHDSNADASIGNITGSNSVNVFLGLGLPWTMAVIYYAILDTDNHVFTQDFVVEAGTLGFSVVVFCCCSIAAFSILMLRRLSCIGGELGAKDTVLGKVCQWVSFSALVGLWILYIVLSICQNKGWIESPAWL